MILFFKKNLFLLLALSLTFCQTDKSTGPTITPVLDCEMITLNHTSPGLRLPVIIIPQNNDLFYGSMEKNIYPVSINNQTNGTDIAIKRGTGCALFDITTQNNFSLKVNNLAGPKEIVYKDTYPVKYVQGELVSSQWFSDTCYVVTDNLTIDESKELTIHAGAKVLLQNMVNIIVYGSLSIEGTKDKPVHFDALEPSGSWGGIEFHNTSATLTYCIFNNGGSDPEKEFGHSHSQPVLFFNETQANMDHCFLFDNPGKALGSSSSTLVIDDCLISRCDTGGEFQGSLVTVRNTRVLDIPNDDHIFSDDDNDGFYFSGHANTEEPSLVEKCLIITGKDDAIDHNKAKLVIKDCLLQDCMHEGVAASNGNYAKVSNCVITDCDQGIEAGYYGPIVFVDHCVLINNNVGLRFGDSYDWGCNGEMQATNTILYNNQDNIYNYDVKSQGPKPNGINISYSLTNDGDYNQYSGCLTGTPVFDNHYQLLPGSPGIQAGSDQTNMGLQ